MITLATFVDGSKPGKVSLLKPRYAKDFPQTLSAHDIGLKDLVQPSALLGFLPEIYLVTVSISDKQPLNMELSREVQESLSEIEMTVKKLISEI